MNRFNMPKYREGALKLLTDCNLSEAWTVYVDQPTSPAVPVRKITAVVRAVIRRQRLSVPQAQFIRSLLTEIKTGK